MYTALITHMYSEELCTYKYTALIRHMYTALITHICILYLQVYCSYYTYVYCTYYAPICRANGMEKASFARIVGAG